MTMTYFEWMDACALLIIFFFHTRHPIFLPKNLPMKRLVIVDKHKGLGHESGVEQVLTELQSHF